MGPGRVRCSRCTRACIDRLLAWLKGLSGRAASRRASALLPSLGLAELGDRKAGALSGGQLRRVGLAEAMVASPDVLLLDEPTAGLDPAQRGYFRDILVGAGQTCLVSTHLVDDIDDTFDRVVVLVASHVRFDGTVEEFLDSRAVRVHGGRASSGQLRQGRDPLRWWDSWRWTGASVFSSYVTANRGGAWS